ncbi:hypothetical protein C1W90_07620 [Burkholderia pseudomallei]|uniref:Uncharacterized protein n=1 Tax=Burkholderia mallei TaxID=13373 RepID=A0AAX1ZUB8_BURML|nr:hypothetical protein [Burkholderia pseudomallei]RUN03871.1 hypothetical protein EGT61_031255 [Burkholderia mallei]MBK3339147.1 hypothetical protein [Burkholderia pseudomallei]MBM5577031.1 hypothetical protein [Burkholderia pseudomallei]MBM5644051.1 hypothetical protein [Burkholderia pseudomallei]
MKRIARRAAQSDRTSSTSPATRAFRRVSRLSERTLHRLSEAACRSRGAPHVCYAADTIRRRFLDEI